MLKCAHCVLQGVFLAHQAAPAAAAANWSWCSAATFRDSRAFSSSEGKDASKPKMHILKCTKAPLSSPISQAVAFMLSREQIPKEQLLDTMDLLSTQMLADVGSYSSTEMAAFTEACRQMNYFHQECFHAMLKHLAPSAASIAADELPSLLWAGARLAAAAAPAAQAGGSSSSAAEVPQKHHEQHQQDHQQHPSSSSGSGKAWVPSNDGIKGSVSSSRIAGLPGVLEFVLGASQVLTGDVEDVSSEELPVLAAALADMEYRDPFLLTVLADACIDRQSELSGSELLSLLSSFAAMGRWFFDNRLLDALAVQVMERGQQGELPAAAVQQVAAELAAINYKNKALLNYTQP